MKKLLATTIALVVMSAAGIAVAETTKYTTKGSHVDATWSSYDECSSSYVNVMGSESATRQTKTGPVTGSYVSAYYSFSSWCNDEYTYQSGYASGEGEVAIGPKGATLKATLSGYNYDTGETDTLEVDLTAVGNGEFTSKGTSHDTFSSGTYRYKSRQTGTSESADATGTVVLNGTAIATGEATWAGVGKSSYGTMEFYKPDAAAQ